MSGIEVASLVLPVVQVLQAFVKATSPLNLREHPLLRGISLHMCMLKDCIAVLESMREDNVPEAIQAAADECVMLGKQLSERETTTTPNFQRRVRFILADEDKLRSLAKGFRESVTLLHNLTQSLLLRNLMSRQEFAAESILHVNKIVESRLFDLFRLQHESHLQESRGDWQSTLTKTSSATVKTEMTADIATLADEAASRAMAKGVLAGTDPSLTLGTIVLTHLEKPSYVPVRAKYDTGADANFISYRFTEQHNLRELLNDLSGEGSEEVIFDGLDDHEYRIRHTVTLHWCSATMHRMRKTLFHVATQLPYDLLLGNDFIQENSVLSFPRPALPLQMRRKSKDQRDEETQRRKEREKLADAEVLRVREEERARRALAKEARRALKEQTSASSMMHAPLSNLVNTSSATSSTSGAQDPSGTTSFSTQTSPSS